MALRQQGLRSNAQKGDFVNEDKSSTGCYRESHILALSGPFCCLDAPAVLVLYLAGSHPSLAAGSGQPLRPGLCNCGGEKEN